MEKQQNQETLFSIGLELSKQLHEINKDVKKTKFRIPRFNTPKSFVEPEENSSYIQPSQAGMDYWGKLVF